MKGRIKVERRKRNEMETTLYEEKVVEGRKSRKKEREELRNNI